MAPLPEIQTLQHKLRLERKKMLDAIQTLTPEKLLQAPDGGWSIQDILAHLSNAERVNVKFARLMLDTDKPRQIEAVRADYPDYTGEFDLDRFNAYMTNKLRGRSTAEVLEALEQTRAATYEWLDTLTAEQLERTGEHAAWGVQSVRGMIKILMLHDKMHTQEILKRL